MDVMTGRYAVGDVIRYSPFGGGIRRVRVNRIEAEIKNGRAGFTGVALDEAGREVPDEFEPGQPFRVWGYDEQIVALGLGPA